MLRPLVAILCPREFTFSEDAALIETAELSAVAEVRTFRLDFNAPLPAEVRAADALILWHNVACTAEVIASLANCRVLIRNGVGYDSVDTGAAARRGIPVCNVPDYGTEEVADHTIALTLALCRQLFPLDAEAKRLGSQIGIGQDIALRNLEDVRKRAFMADVQRRDIARANPVLAGFLSEPTFANEASDDIGALEQIGSFFADVGRAVAGQPLQYIPMELARGYMRGQRVAERGEIGTRAITQVIMGETPDTNLERAKQIQEEMRKYQGPPTGN